MACLYPVLEFKFAEFKGSKYNNYNNNSTSMEKNFFHLSACMVLIQAQEIPSVSGVPADRVDISQCSEEYPFKLESSACLKPGGVRCSGMA